MCNSMKKFKKLAVLAITIPTLLSSTNISFAMKAIHDANGLGSFQTINRFFKKKLDHTTNKKHLQILRKQYDECECMIILSLNYIHSFITLYTAKDFKDALNSGKEARKLFDEIATDDESEILKVAVNVILYILNRNILKLNDQQQQKNCWASIKYVVNELDTSKIEQRKVVKLDENDQLFYNFLLRGKNKIGNKGKGFAVELIKKLQEQLNSEEYKRTYNGGNYSFGEFVFKNAIKVCTINDGKLPDFTGYSSANVYNEQIEIDDKSIIRNVDVILKMLGENIPKLDNEQKKDFRKSIKCVANKLDTSKIEKHKGISAIKKPKTTPKCQSF